MITLRVVQLDDVSRHESGMTVCRWLAGMFANDLDNAIRVDSLTSAAKQEGVTHSGKLGRQLRAARHLDSQIGASRRTPDGTAVFANVVV